jgi:hypothetical protein
VIRRITPQDLRSHVGRGSPDEGAVLRPPFAHEPEIDEFDSGIPARRLLDENVLRFDVEVDQAVGMDVMQSPAGLHDVVQDLVEVRFPGGFEEVVPFDVFGGEVMARAVVQGAEVENVLHVGVSEGFQGSELVDEDVQVVGSAFQTGDHFQADPAPGDRILRQEDGGHAPGAEVFEEAVPSVHHLSDLLALLVAHGGNSAYG